MKKIHENVHVLCCHVNFSFSAYHYIIRVKGPLVWCYTRLTRSEGRQGAVLLEPGEDRAAELLRATRGDHAVVGLKQLPENDAELSIIVKEETHG